MDKNRAEEFIHSCDFGNVAGKRILDIGCGNFSGQDNGVPHYTNDKWWPGGWIPGCFIPGLARLLAKQGANVVGIDRFSADPDERYTHITANIARTRLRDAVSGHFDIAIATSFFDSPSLHECIGNGREPLRDFSRNVFTDVAGLLNQGGLFVLKDAFVDVNPGWRCEVTQSLEGLGLVLTVPNGNASIAEILEKRYLNDEPLMYRKCRQV